MSKPALDLERIREVLARESAVRLAYLFGSQARGTAGESASTSSPGSTA